MATLCTHPVWAMTSPWLHDALLEMDSRQYDSNVNESANAKKNAEANDKGGLTWKQFAQQPNVYPCESDVVESDSVSLPSKQSLCLDDVPYYQSAGYGAQLTHEKSLAQGRLQLFFPYSPHRLSAIQLGLFKDQYQLIRAEHQEDHFELSAHLTRDSTSEEILAADKALFLFLNHAPRRVNQNGLSLTYVPNSQRFSLPQRHRAILKVVDDEIVMTITFPLEMTPSNR